jgi:hypothetical protein
MDFLKKHYEKVILSAVLLGVIGFLVFLPFVISGDQAEQKAMASAVTKPKITPLPALDLAQQKNATERVMTAAAFDFYTTNKLFNPVEWKKDASGNLIKIKTGNEVVEAAVVTKILPLYFVMSLDQVTTNQTGARYAIGVERQGAASAAMRRKVQRFVSVDDRKKDLFTLVDVKGAVENPSELILKSADTGENISLSKEKPFRRVDGYMADLKYDPEKKNFPARRVGAIINFGGQDYIIVAIDADGLILSDQSNQKHTTLHYASTP